MPRKPPVALRIVNRLGKLAPADVKALIDATERLRQGSGDGLREAMNDQREALRRLADAAGRAALEEGTKPGLALQRRVQNTVRAAALSEPDALREGALEHELQPSGFDTLAGAPPARQRSPAKEHQQAAAQKKEQARLARELQKAEQAANKAEAQAQRLEQATEEAEQAAARARERADEARRAAGEAAARALELRRRQ